MKIGLIFLKTMITTSLMMTTKTTLTAMMMIMMMILTTMMMIMMMILTAMMMIMMMILTTMTKLGMTSRSTSTINHWTDQELNPGRENLTIKIPKLSFSSFNCHVIGLNIIRCLHDTC